MVVEYDFYGKYGVPDVSWTWGQYVQPNNTFRQDVESTVIRQITLGTRDNNKEFVDPEDFKIRYFEGIRNTTIRISSEEYDSQIRSVQYEFKCERRKILEGR